MVWFILWFNNCEISFYNFAAVPTLPTVGWDTLRRGIEPEFYALATLINLACCASACRRIDGTPPARANRAPGASSHAQIRRWRWMWLHADPGAERGRPRALAYRRNLAGTVAGRFAICIPVNWPAS
jgi:hypothetical protein